METAALIGLALGGAHYTDIEPLGQRLLLCDVLKAQILRTLASSLCVTAKNGTLQMP